MIATTLFLDKTIQEYFYQQSPRLMDSEAGPIIFTQQQPHAQPNHNTHFWICNHKLSLTESHKESFENTSHYFPQTEQKPFTVSMNDFWILDVMCYVWHISTSGEKPRSHLCELRLERGFSTLFWSKCKEIKTPPTNSITEKEWKNWRIFLTLIVFWSMYISLWCCGDPGGFLEHAVATLLARHCCSSLRGEKEKALSGFSSSSRQLRSEKQLHFIWAKPEELRASQTASDVSCWLSSLLAERKLVWFKRSIGGVYYSCLLCAQCASFERKSPPSAFLSEQLCNRLEPLEVQLPHFLLASSEIKVLGTKDDELMKRLGLKGRDGVRVLLLEQLSG